MYSPVRVATFKANGYYIEHCTFWTILLPHGDPCTWVGLGGGKEGKKMTQTVSLMGVEIVRAYLFKGQW